MDNLFDYFETWAQETLHVLAEEAELEILESNNRYYNPDANEGKDIMETM